MSVGVPRPSRVESARDLGAKLAIEDEQATATPASQTKDLFEIQNISLPQQAQAGETVTGSFEVQSTGPLGGPGAPDWCQPSQLFRDGKRLNLIVRSGGVILRNVSRCVPEGPSSRSVTFQFAIPAEASGSVTLDLVVQGSGSGTIYADRTVTTQVTGAGEGDVTPEPVDQPGQEPGQRAPFRPFLCLLNPLRGCNTLELVTMAGSAFLLVLILILAAV